MTLLKYMLYALLAIVLYVVARGFYDGSFNAEMTAGQIETQSKTVGSNMFFS